MTKISNQYSLTNILTADLANSRLGINNVSPTVALDVTGAGKFSGILTLGSTISNGTYTYTLPSATGTLALTSALSGYLPLTGGTLTGALGIGNTASSPLDVTADNSTAINLRLRGRALDNVGQMEFWNNAQSTRFGYIATDSSNMQIFTTQAIPLIFGTNTTTRLTIASTGAATFSGNVNIAVADPRLFIKKTSNSQESDIIFQENNNGHWILSDNSTSNDFSLYNYNTATNNLYVKYSNGNVGIGTSSPSAKLTVVGANANTYISIDNAAAGENYFGANAFQVFQTAGTERMRITAGGKVGIGNSSPSEVLDVTGSVKASSGMYANFHEGEFGQILASTPYAGAFISKNLAELDPGIYLINAYMMRGGGGVNQTYSVMWYYMHLSGFGGGSDAITALYNNPGPQNNDGRIALTGAGYTVEITWGGARGPAGVTATKLRDAY